MICELTKVYRFSRQEEGMASQTDRFIDAKMEELLDDMRSLFNGLGPEPNQEVVLKHVPDLSLETRNILSMTGWRREPTPTKTPIKPAQPGPSKSTKETQEEGPLRQAKSQPTPLEQVAGVVMTTKEIHVDDNEMAKQLLGGTQDRPDQLSRSKTPQQTARIDVVQTKVDERPTKWTQELPTPLETSTPEPTQVKTSVSQFMQTSTSTFTNKLQRIITPQRFFNPLKYKMTPKKMMVRRF